MRCHSAHVPGTARRHIRVSVHIEPGDVRIVATPFGSLVEWKGTRSGGLAEAGHQSGGSSALVAD